MMNRILKNLKLKLQKKYSTNAEEVILYLKLIQEITTPSENSISCIIFSMDRALQLDALLRSFFLNKSGDCNVHILYRATTDMHEKAYQELVDLYQENVLFTQESGSGFKTQLMDIVQNIRTGKLFFLVDDILFTEKVNFDKLAKIDASKYIFSLRMGSHLNHSYVVNKEQTLPSFFNSDENYLYWKWNEGELDWAYPLSVDGHIFNTAEIKLLIEYSDFKAPNSFESALQRYKDLFISRIGMCYHKARIVNNPCNKVQNEINNLHGSYHQDDLLKQWQNNKEIDIEKLQGYLNRSVHEEIDFYFKDRVR